MKVFFSFVAAVLISAPSLASKPSCIASCAHGDGFWYHLACLKKAQVGTLIRQYNCDVSEVNESVVSCKEIADGVLRDVTSGSVEQAKKQFYAWCGKNDLFPQ